MGLETVVTLIGQALGPISLLLQRWLGGEGPEPPGLEHLGVPAVTLTKLRQRAKAARELAAPKETDDG